MKDVSPLVRVTLCWKPSVFALSCARIRDASCFSSLMWVLGSYELTC